MAKPRVFISSTHYDLKYLRSSLDVFVESLGYEPILSGKSSIAYSPDTPLDESCYREAQTCEIFVLIIGGRYGSPASGVEIQDEKAFYEQYESVTKLEYESAVRRDIPVYILIENAVYSEYETFKKNRSNESITYAHVDSINIFQFIDRILNQPRNNPIYQFEKPVDIELWLREQWAGLFRELIRTRSSSKEIAEISSMMKNMSSLNTTLKRYMEELVSNVDDQKGQKIIEEENIRMHNESVEIKFQDHPYVMNILDREILSVAQVYELFSKNNTWEDLAREYAQLTGRGDDGQRSIEYWQKNQDILHGYNEVREILGLAPFEYKNKQKYNPK